MAFHTVRITTLEVHAEKKCSEGLKYTLNYLQICMKIVMRFPKIQFCPFSKFSNTGNDFKALSSSFGLGLESPKAGDNNVVANILFITHRVPTNGADL